MQTRADLNKIRRVVVKVGSRLLADDAGRRAGLLAQEFSHLKATGREAVLVSSGAIALGMKEMGWSARPREMARLQAAAAIGQSRLMHTYETAFSQHGLRVGQILLTHSDVRSRRRYLNARKTFAELLSLQVVPVVNENDTVSIDEIKFGDNDRLAALVASLIDADLLIILTDVDGLYTSDPKQGGQWIGEVHNIATEARPYAGGAGSAVGTGGMRSKVDAAEIAGESGIATVIASGDAPTPLESILRGDATGTIFWPQHSPLQARKHWIAHALRPDGSVTVDEGAQKALEQHGRSLLPTGVRQVAGEFDEGDVIRILDTNGREFARGLTRYSAEEVSRVLGKRSVEIEVTLGYVKDEEIVHRDDLVLI